MSLEIFYENVAKGLLVNAVQKIQAQRHTNRLVGREQFIYRIPVTHARLEKTAKKCTTMYCRKCDAGLRIGQCFEVYHSNYWK
jgi:hypothetical protein